MTEDAELLSRYADEQSEAAFAELVRRHLNLVYSVALRQVAGDTHLAEDVTQQVFVALARKAGELAPRPALTGWLYRSTYFAASDVVRVERRRRAREQEVHTMDSNPSGPEANADWDKLRPVLDDAIAELAEGDRDAVSLRFLEGRSFAEVGAKLRLTENAARMRVERALDKLHTALGRRGVTSTATALGLALANQAGVAAPAGLAASVTGAALAAGPLAATAGGVIAFMSTGKIVLGLASVAAIAGVGAAFVAAGSGREAESAFATAAVRQTASNAKLSDLENRAQAEAQRAQRAEAENTRLLAAAQKMKVAPGDAVATAVEPMDSEAVRARFKRAQELVRTGDPAEALRELLWCYDVGMARIGSMLGVRFSYALDSLIELAERHPPARTALLERQSKARTTLLAGEDEFDAAMAFGSISRVLKDGAATVAILDQLPAGDRRRMP
ncbi:MAG: sigma-70 family RNA polymerase sigma factor, partial [Opitutaceae bacterium]